MNQEVRWEQRFGNFRKALSQLNKFIKKGELNELEEQGLIKAFEYTYELAWKTLQDFLREKGYAQIAGPKPVIEQAFQDGYIDGFAWVRMHKSRNLTNSAYEEEVSSELINDIRSEHIQSLSNFAFRLEKKRLIQQS
ncbi:HI0074 family nucleotidyltransferase substrate-binding subunit [Larkinella sp.]|uniref:HI0074 family nucleotidyltransferase substrate-binding subunit n=1 Tax=Larkinella sp. TaxID=2034517 RepID=UPI003BA90280